MRRDGTTPRLLGLLGLLAVLAVLVAQAAIGVPVDGVVTERRAVAATPPLPAWPAGRPGSYTLRYNDSQWSVAEAPGGRLSTRPLHFFWLADCSGSMAADGKTQALRLAWHG